MSTTDDSERGAHWQRVYSEKSEPQLSWHQDEPALSLALLRRLCPRGGSVLDVGGGTSLFASRLASELDAQVTVVDISAAALERARLRAGPAGARMRWVTADVCGPLWPALGEFDVWHDRAVLHFLTDDPERRRYVQRALDAVRPGGHAVIATFAPDGPEQCSGLAVQRYDAAELSGLFRAGFTPIESHRELHTTPWGSTQPFTCVVLRRAAPAALTAPSA